MRNLRQGVSLVTACLMSVGSTGAMQLTVLDPIDGAVLHAKLGRATPQGIEFEMRGEAPVNAEVRINGVTTLRDKETFSGMITLRNGENRFKVAVRERGETLAETTIRVTLLENSYKRYRVVIDDNSFFLRDITQKGYASLFDCPYLKMLKELHDRYGAKFTLNIYYTTGEDWNLAQFPERYKREWQANAHWLHLAFHAYADKPDKPYTDAPVEKLIADHDLITEQILRFAGRETYSPTVVVHWGLTRPEAWKALYERGSRVLGGYFELRGTEWIVNYNMDAFRSEWLSRNDLLKDYASGIVFSNVDMVINSTPLAKIQPLLEEVTSEPRMSEVVDLLTHEQYFWPFYHNYQPDYPQCMERAIKYLTEQGYKPIFLQDLSGD